MHYGQPVDDALDVGMAVHAGEKVAVHEVRGDRLPFDGTVEETTSLHIAEVRFCACVERCYVLTPRLPPPSFSVQCPPTAAARSAAWA